MDRFRVEAFVKEFPFLKEFPRTIEDPSDLESIQVRRLDENILRSKGYISEAVGSVVSIYRGSKFYLVYALEGKTYKAVEVPPEHDFHSNYAHEDGYHEEGTSVLERIDEVFQEMAALPVAVVELEFGLETVDHHSRRRRLTIYKPKKGLSILGLIQRAKAQAEADVQAMKEEAGIE